MSQVLTILIIFATLVGVAYVLWRPRWAVLVVLVMFPLMQLLQANSGVLNQNKYLMNLAIGFLAVFALISKVFKRETVFSGYNNPATIMVFALYGWATLSTLWSPAQGPALDFLIGAVPYIALFLIVTPLLLTDLVDMRRIWIGMMVLGTIIAISIALSPRAGFMGGRLMIDVGMYAGQEGGQLNALATAQFGGMLMVIAALVQFGKAAWLLNWIRAAAFISGLGLAILTGSRGQVIACVIAGIVCYPLARRVQNPKQFFAVAAGFGFIVVGVYFAFRTFIGHDNITRWDLNLMAQGFSSRFESVLTLMTEYLANPGMWLVGLGSNAFSTLSTDGYVHNMLAEVLAEQGIIGAVILAILLYHTVVAGRRVWSLYRDEPLMRSVVAVLCAVCFYEFILTLKQGSFLGFPAFLYWCLILSKLSKHEVAMAVEWQHEEVAEGEDEEWDDQREVAVAY
ncbi:MAG TPA: hypothetical protein PK400_08310 [Phycisphaerales bacterium]|nr:hypothetical protein [Phycisphaerales bacterium]HRQ75546.1 hypothetical protein [Phycisphaerales bacterium]